MGQFLDISKYTIYRLKTDDGLRVAVPIAYAAQINGLINEYGSLEKIPSSKTVRGVFIKNHSEGKAPEMVAATTQENDITVNQLKPI